MTMDLKSNTSPAAGSDIHIYPAATSHLTTTYRRSTDLTNREREALHYLAAGYSSDQIGQLLYISKQTVDSHRKNIIKKLSVPNVTAAVAYALRNKLIS
jgi:DNA-binding CsgD family transcriptional regulator